MQTKQKKGKTKQKQKTIKANQKKQKPNQRKTKKHTHIKQTKMQFQTFYLNHWLHLNFIVLRTRKEKMK